MRRGELPFRLVVEQVDPEGQVRVAVIVGRLVAGSIHIGDRLELLEPGAGDRAEAVPVTCETYSLLCEVDWTPSKDPLLAVTVQGIEAGRVKAGSILRAAT